MDTLAHRPTRHAALLLASLLAALLVVTTLSAPALAEATDRVVIAAEERERRPIAQTPRDQLGLVLYGFLAFTVLAGGATLRRQLKGERPTADGEFRWR
jgi:hypothetical protein